MLQANYKILLFLFSKLKMVIEEKGEPGGFLEMFSTLEIFSTLGRI